MIDFEFGISQFTTTPWTFERDMEAYARLGAQAVEISEFKLDAGRWAAQMALPAAHGLRVSSVQPVVRTLFPSMSQPQPRDPAQRIDCFKDSIRRLAPHAPGAAFVTNTGIPPSGDIQNVLDTCAALYADLALFAAAHGVRVALEPLSASIMNIETAIWTVTQALDVIDRVGHANFGLCLDCWNVWQNADLAGAIAQAGPSIFVVQVSDWRTPRSFLDRLIPGTGAIPLRDFLQNVHATGFHGAYSLEIFSDGFANSLWSGDLEAVIIQSRQGLTHAFDFA